MSDYIEVGQSLQFTDPNTPTRVGEIVENVSDIYNIPSPRLGMQVFVKSEKKSFVITSLKNKVIGGVDVPEAAVAAFEAVGAKSITWNNDTNPSNMNDFVVAGVYDIKGERTRANDNLPILNTGGGHTFHARLEVLDSSIAPEGKSDDICITQKLTLSNRVAGDGDVYIRTGRGANKQSITWETWGKMQQNIEVGEVASLDNLIDNGIYSGVWTKGSYNAYPLTFVCIVINDYIIGIAPRRISQFVYGLSKFDGTVVCRTRVWDDSKNVWGDWQSIGGGSSYTLPIATADVLGGIKSNSTYGYIGDNPFGNEHAVNVGNDGRATVTIPVANNQNHGVVKVDSSVNSESDNPVSGKAVAEAIANIGDGGGDITATPTKVVIEEIEPTLVSTAIRKTPQVLTDAEKEIARGNIGAVAHSDLNNAIANAITNTLNTAV